MRKVLSKRYVIDSSIPSTCLASLPFLLSPGRGIRGCSFSSTGAGGGREDPGFFYGLSSALAVKGVIVKDKAFRNLSASELQQKGATFAESLTGFPVHVRGNVVRGASEISKLQFGKLLKQVTTHLSSISDIYVHDGAIGSSSKCGAKVCVISDSPSSVLRLSNILWEVSSRSISHDSCPLTVYVATSISQGAVDAVGLRPQANKWVIAADVDHSSLILCGKAFSDINAVKETLITLSEPVICARGGIPLPARLLVSGDTVILFFALKTTIQSAKDQLVSARAGVILSSQGASPYFPTKRSSGPGLFKFPAAVILVTSDSSGTIPYISKLSPGQAAYHFLVGYQNGKFMPAYSEGLSSVDALELAKALLSKLKENQVSSFLVNFGEKSVTGKDLLTLVQSALSSNVPSFRPKGRDIESTYKSFLSSKFPEIPKEFSF